jgi:hypothetical protein
MHLLHHRRLFKHLDSLCGSGKLSDRSSQSYGQVGYELDDLVLGDPRTFNRGDYG